MPSLEKTNSLKLAFLAGFQGNSHPPLLLVLVQVEVHGLLLVQDGTVVGDVKHGDLVPHVLILRL